VLADELRFALGGDAEGIEHVGSTAVAGLAAKPILDVVVGLAGRADLGDVTGKLEELGYEFRGDKGEAGGCLFVLEDTPKNRVAHVHLVRHDDELWNRYLAFRDRLRDDPDAQTAYASLKRELARQHRHDRAAYTAGKDEQITRLLGLSPFPRVTGAPGVRTHRADRLDDPNLVASEYASETALEERNAAYRGLSVGVDAERVAREAVLATGPRRVLEVGCGTGEFALSLRAGGIAEIVAVDISPRMVEIATARGVDARVGDVERLAFDEGEFDCAVAAWMLYHVPHLDRALAELARVVAAGGRFVACTIANDTRPDELDRLLQTSPDAGYTFSSENGREMLLDHFERVDQTDCPFTLVFPDHHALRRYVAALPTRGHLADAVPAFEGEFRRTARLTVFVAHRPKHGQDGRRSRGTNP
jgi:GrpB-like predicted nucleotidyltransferase (UPF0157 family)/SAM-dependent methyltransferase